MNVLDKRRFENKFIKSSKNECWNWLASKNKEGYGQFSLDGKMIRAHRISYEIYKDKIPENMCVCHHCDNPSCVNPDHLFIGTDLDNNRDMMMKGRANKSSGESNGQSKLTWRNVKEIRRLNKSNKLSQEEIAKKFGISRPAVQKIVYNLVWFDSSYIYTPKFPKLYGENNGRAKLKEKDVIKIRKLYKTGKYFQKDLAEMYGVSINSISHAVNYKSWKNI